MRRSPFEKTRLFVTSLVSVCLIGGTIALHPVRVSAAEQDSALSRFAEVYQLLEQNHISGPGKDKLADEAIQGMIESLNDPYTEYYNAEQWKQFQDSLMHNYVGIGTRIGQDEDGFVVLEVFDGSPAADAGLRGGDYIVQVGGQPTKGLTIDQVVEAVRGPEGSFADITVLREGKQIEIKAKRKTIHLPTVVSTVLDGGTGYIQLTGFASDSDEQFAAQLEELKRQKIRSLIVDVRNNPGGILETAQHIAEQFIPEGTLIHTKDRYGQDDPVPITGGRELTIPVVFLVNGGSASASEVLAGALQDYGKAKIIGTQTYGKGSVQTIYQLASGGALKVTVEEYLTPKGRPVNKVGITPDIVVDGSIPQLLTALRAAGNREITLAVGKHAVRVNGYAFFEPVSVIREDGRLYVPARVLGALVGASVTWNEQSRSVEIGDGTTSAAFGEYGGFVIRGGTGYVDLQRFQERFPQLKWTADVNEIVLQVKETN